MDLTLPEEIQLIQDQTRRLVERELAPRTKEIEEAGQIPGELLDKMRELGYFGITIPEPYGGMGLGALAYCVVQEELAKAHAGFNLMISGNNGIGAKAIMIDGTDEQRERYLPPLARGERIAAFALTEPGAGSDAAAIEMTADRDGDDFVLNGMKHFITRGDVADLFTVIAVTDRKLRARGGITIFIVEKGVPGFRLGRVQETMGTDVVRQAELVFENCRIPAANVIGEIGWGFRTTIKVLDHGRLSTGARAAGVARKLLDMSTEHAKQRVQFGKPIGENQAIQWMLVDMATELYATQCMVRDAAWRLDQGERVSDQVSMIKVFAAEMACRAADKALQIHGGMGYMKDFPIESIYRDVRMMRIVEGTSEVHRMRVARSLLKD